MDKSDITFVIRFLQLNGYDLNTNNPETGGFTLHKNNITVTNSENQIRFEIGFSKEIQKESVDSDEFDFDTNILLYVSIYCLAHKLTKIEKALYKSLDQIQI